MTITAWDVETNIVDGTASPYHKDTRVFVRAPLVREGVICGHNIAFDVLHALKDMGEMQEWSQALLFNPDILLWDTGIVDYLYYGCRYRSPSLEESCARWDVPFTKDPLIIEYFESGRGADALIADGHEERLRTYHAEDLRATEDLAIRQMAALNGSRLLPVVQVQLEALKFIILEQFCGLPVDLIALDAETVKARGEIALHEQHLKRMVGLDVFNPGSPEQVALVLNGGEIVEERRVEVAKYKTGKKIGLPRFKIENDVYPLPRRIATPVPNADEKVLSRLVAEAQSPWVTEFCKGVLAYRETSKLLGTYLEPIAKQVACSFDGRLHGDINMAVTNTGRKSSSNPNLQNIPDIVRRLIRARPGWKIVAADFKQLEVVAAAYLSGDPDLRQLVIDGRDIHGETQEDVKQRGVEVERRAIKGVVFGGWIYGGGPVTVSGQTGVPAEIIKLVQASLRGRFPVATAYGCDVVAPALDRDSSPYNDKECPLPHRQAYYELPSGRRLWFRTYPAKPSKWKRNPSPVEFSYTQRKNRPVQSFATADIVPLAESMLMRELQKRGPSVLEYMRPMVSVHDEVVFEVRENAISDIRNLMGIIESNIVSEINKRFQLDPPFDLPLKIEVGVGDTWSGAKP